MTDDLELVADDTMPMRFDHEKKPFRADPERLSRP